MALQIANPAVIGKIDRLAKSIGLSKLAAVEKAVDRLLLETAGSKDESRLSRLLEQLDRVPDRSKPLDPLEWDEHGLPR